MPRDADSVRSVAEAPRGPHATSLLLSVTRGAPSDDVGVRPRLLLQAPAPARVRAGLGDSDAGSGVGTSHIPPHAGHSPPLQPGVPRSRTRVQRIWGTRFKQTQGPDL